MPSDLQVTNLRASDGTAGLVIADSTGEITSGTIGGGVSMGSSGLTVRNIEEDWLASDVDISSNNSYFVAQTATYTPKFSGSKVMAIWTYLGYTRYDGGNDTRVWLKMAFTGANISDIVFANQSGHIGGYDYSGSGIFFSFAQNVSGPLLTTTGIGEITNTISGKQETNHANAGFYLYGNGSSETKCTWIEYK